MGLKDYAKKKIHQYKEDYKDNQKFNKQVSQTKKQAYRKQLLKEAGKQGVKSAKHKYTKKPSAGFNIFGDPPKKGKSKKPKNPFDLDMGNLF